MRAGKRWHGTLIPMLLTCTMVLGITACGGVAPNSGDNGQRGVTSTSTSPLYSWLLTELGDGVHGGGTLNHDGTAGGTMAFSALNGQITWSQTAVSWHYAVPGVLVDICYDVTPITGTPLVPTPHYCLSDIGVVLPVTGQAKPLAAEGDFSKILIKVAPVGN